MNNEIPFLVNGRESIVVKSTTNQERGENHPPAGRNTLCTSASRIGIVLSNDAPRLCVTQWPNWADLFSGRHAIYGNSCCA